MKTKSLTIISILAGASLSHSAILQGGSVANLDGSLPDTVILGGNGSPLASGYYGVGFFNLNDTEITNFSTSQDFTSLRTAFVALASDNFLTGVPDIIGAGATPGLAIVGNPDFNPTPALNRTLFTFISDGSSLGDSSAYALYRHDGLTITADPENPPPITYQADLTGGTLLIGTLSSEPFPLDVTDVGQVTFNQTVQLVPEPSTLLLSFIGAISLLRRKR